MLGVWTIGFWYSASQSRLVTLAMFPSQIAHWEWLDYSKKLRLWNTGRATMKKIPCLGYCLLQGCFIWCPKYHLGNFLLGEIYQPPRSGVQRKWREGTITGPLADLKEQNRLCFTFPNPIVKKKVQNMSYLLILLNQDSKVVSCKVIMNHVEGNSGTRLSVGNYQ